MLKPPDETTAAAQLARAQGEQRFQRVRLLPEVLMTQVTMHQGETSNCHYHTTTRDTFYVMRGRLTVTLEVDPARPGASYHAFSARPPSISPADGGKEVHEVKLEPGEVFIINTNVAHFTANVDPEPCHFLCIEGVGSYDCLPAPSFAKS